MSPRHSGLRLGVVQGNMFMRRAIVACQDCFTERHDAIRLCLGADLHGALKAVKVILDRSVASKQECKRPPDSGMPEQDKLRAAPSGQGAHQVNLRTNAARLSSEQLVQSNL